MVNKVNNILHARYIIAAKIRTACLASIDITEIGALPKQVGSLLIEVKVNHYTDCDLYVKVVLLTPGNKVKLEPKIGQIASGGGGVGEIHQAR